MLRVIFPQRRVARYRRGQAHGAGGGDGSVRDGGRRAARLISGFEEGFLRRFGQIVHGGSGRGGLGNSRSHARPESLRCLDLLRVQKSAAAEDKQAGQKRGLHFNSGWMKLKRAQRSVAGMFGLIGATGADGAAVGAGEGAAVAAGAELAAGAS